MTAKRIIALILCLVLCLAMLSASAFAEAESSPISLEPMQNAREDDNPPQGEMGVGEWDEVIATGSCGDALTWKLYDTGRLKIAGTGAMWEYEAYAAPWGRDILTVGITDGVTGISGAAFFGCEALTEVTLSASVTAIGIGAFANCPALERIDVSADNSAYKSVGGVLFSKSGTELIAVPGGIAGEYPIPSGVTDIGAFAFYGCAALTGVTVPTTVTGIGNGAFYGCDSLTDVYYSGTQAQWSAVTVGISNEPLTRATVHVHTHVFSQRIVSDEYKASDATCTKSAKYFFSCECGELGTLTFDHGAPLGHSFSDAWTHDATHHWHAATCEHTAEVSGKATHDWDNGVVTKEATTAEEGVMTFTCTVCEATRTESIPMLPVPGDLNGDRAADDADVLLLMDYVKARGISVTLAADGDLTGDGRIDNADILRLMKLVG